MKRRREEFAKSESDALIRRIFPAAAITWQEVPQAQEPPDWCLTIDRDMYAVEATSVFERIPTCSGQVSSGSISAALHRFIDEVEAIALREGILTGAYVVWLCPIPDFSARKAEIRRRLLDYIRDTQIVPTAPRADVLEVGPWRCISIQKLNNEKKFVAEVVSFDVKIESEVQQELSNAIDAVLTNKAENFSTFASQ